MIINISLIDYNLIDKSKHHYGDLSVNLNIYMHHISDFKSECSKHQDIIKKGPDIQHLCFIL